jgi:hypothetical protein
MLGYLRPFWTIGWQPLLIVRAYVRMIVNFTGTLNGNGEMSFLRPLGRLEAGELI